MRMGRHGMEIVRVRMPSGWHGMAMPAGAQGRNPGERAFHPRNSHDDARRGNMLGRKIDPDRVPESFRVLGYVRLGPRYVRDARALDPWREIARYEGPVFICHGAKDDIVDIGYARKAAEVYPHARLVELPGARHVFAMPWTVHRAVRETVGFLKEAAKV